jgi:hypothetical protein
MLRSVRDEGASDRMNYLLPANTNMLSNEEIQYIDHEAAKLPYKKAAVIEA